MLIVMADGSMTSLRTVDLLKVVFYSSVVTIPPLDDLVHSYNIL